MGLEGSSDGSRPSVAAIDRTTSTPRRQTAAEKLGHLKNQNDLELRVRTWPQLEWASSASPLPPSPGYVCVVCPLPEFGVADGLPRTRERSGPSRLRRWLVRR
jgi:hypothetical protein